MSSNAVKKSFLFSSALLFFVSLFSFVFAGTALAASKCSLSMGALVDCSQYAEEIQAAGHDPNDPTKCYGIWSQQVVVESCSSAPFNRLPGETVSEAADRANQEEQRRIVVQNQEQLDEEIKNAESEGSGRVHCNSPEECINNNPITQIIIVAISIMGGVVGVVVVAVIIVAGIQYSSAGGDPNKTAAAKKRILNAIIALVAYLFLYVLLNWLLPGGLF